MATPIISTSDSPPSSVSNSEVLQSPKFPRKKRLGGFVVNNEIARKWACRLNGQEFDPDLNIGRVWQTLKPRARSFGVVLRPIGEDACEEWMVITQTRRFDGWKDMPESLIPQFEEGPVEAKARELLEAEGRTLSVETVIYLFRISGLSPNEFTFATRLTAY